MFLELGGDFAGRVEINGEVAAVFEKLDAREGRAEGDVEGFPVSGLTQGAADAVRGVTEEADHRHAAEEAALEEDEVGVEVADDGALDLREFLLNLWNFGEVGQRTGIVAEQEDALIGLEIDERAANFLEVMGQQGVPFGDFAFEHFAFEDRQGKQAGGDANQDVFAHHESPEWFEIEP